MWYIALAGGIGQLKKEIRDNVYTELNLNNLEKLGLESILLQTNEDYLCDEYQGYATALGGKLYEYSITNHASNYRTIFRGI